VAHCADPDWDFFHSHALQCNCAQANLHNDWFVKAAKEIEVELDEDVLVDNNDAVETQRIIASKKQQLAALLQRPIFPKGFSGRFETVFFFRFLGLTHARRIPSEVFASAFSDGESFMN